MKQQVSIFDRKPKIKYKMKMKQISLHQFQDKFNNFMLRYQLNID